MIKSDLQEGVIVLLTIGIKGVVCFDTKYGDVIVCAKNRGKVKLENEDGIIISDEFRYINVSDYDETLCHSNPNLSITSIKSIEDYINRIPYF